MPVFIDFLLLRKKMRLVLYFCEPLDKLKTRSELCLIIDNLTSVFLRIVSKSIHVLDRPKILYVEHSPEKACNNEV